MTTKTGRAQSPLYDLLNQINEAANHGLPLLAIGMAVALPDICVSLSSEDGRSDGKRYKEWCAANLPSDQFSYVTPKDLYSMRCGVLHNGRFGDMQHEVKSVIFTLPSGVSFTNCRSNDVYLYGVVEFCKNLCDAAYRWHQSVKDNPIVQENAKRLMQIHPNGISPHIVGMPVIA